jgi:hypothetical protein
MNVLLRLLSSPEAGQFGSLLSGVATVSATGVALWVAKKVVPDQMRAWRTQQRTQQRVDAAVRALVSVRHFAVALKTLTDPFSFERERPAGGDEVPEKQRRQAAFTSLWTSRLSLLSGDFNDYVRTWSATVPLLPNDVDAVLKEGWNIRAEILTSGSEHASNLGDSGVAPADRTRAFQGTMGPKIVARIDQWEEKAVAVLKPLASYEKESMH